MPLVEKNELETQFLAMFSQTIFIQRWFPIIFTTSLVPFITLSVFVMDMQMDNMQFFAKLKFLKFIAISILYIIVPIVLWVVNHLYPKDFYEISEYRISFYKSVPISTTHISSLKAKHNGRFFSDLLIQSERLLDEMITMSHGFGECATSGRYPMSPPFPGFILQLKTNLVNLKSLSMDKRFFVLSVVLLLLHFHIKYCFS